MNNVPHERKHPAVRVQVGPWNAEIDEAIAPLIREIWIAGIETFMSCQEDGWGKVWIAFLELEGVVEFLNIVGQYEAGSEAIYHRMNPYLRSSDSRLDWDFEMFGEDAALSRRTSDGTDEEQYQHAGQPDFYFTFSVRFPPFDLPTVLARMVRHNRRWMTHAIGNTASR